MCGADALHLYQDTIAGGYWHYCKGCKSSGNMIDLAAATWQVSNRAALLRMAELGVALPEDCLSVEKVTKYETDEVAKRTRMNALWEQARTEYLQVRSDNMCYLRRRYCLLLDVSPERWAAGPGHLIGATHKVNMQKAIHPGVMANNGWDMSTHPVFVGSGWKEVILAPWYDLPNRIIAFSVIGRTGDPGRDQFWRKVSWFKPEAGLAGLPSVDLAESKNYVIAVNDWLLMLQMQMRNFRSSTVAMPIVTWRDDGKRRTSDAWTLLAGRSILFWCDKLDAKTIRQAIQTDGQIVMQDTMKANRQQVQQYLKNNLVTDIEKAIVRNAKPWPVALRNWMKKAGGGEASVLLADLEAAGVDVSYVMKQVGPGRHLPVLPTAARSIVMGRLTLKEHGDTWTACNVRTRQPNEIANARLVLFYAIKDKATSEMFYYGEVRHKGKRVAFVEKLDVVRDRPGAFIRDILVQHSLGVFIYKTALNGVPIPLHQVAVAFNEPEFTVDDVWKWVERVEAENEEI
jgi:hypothetical protein